MSSEHLSRLRAPRDHGQFLLLPPASEVGALVRRNRTLLGDSSTVLGDLPAVRATARTETLEAAREYLAAAAEPSLLECKPHLFVAGHQPEFFHPGVWVKNFVLHALAKRHDAVALNLVVDDDTAKSTHLLLPAGDHVARVAFDRWQSQVPFEERHVLDEELWASLPERAEAVIRKWPFRPWLAEIWDIARRQKTPLLGERIVRTRRALERTMGIRPLEVPLSAVCRTPSFAKFASTLLRELPDFHRKYNEAVAGYRQRHGLKSKNHPVPDLGRDQERYEAPFWAWRRGDQRRRRLYVEVAGGSVTLWAESDRLGNFVGPAMSWPEQWRALESEGIRIRTRALTTTLFTRLYLADVFMHGLGGGKYDEVTDDLIRAFVGIEPPQYLVATATLLLPLPRHPEADGELAKLHRDGRDLWWNPQRHVAPTEAAIRIAERQAALELPESTHEERVERFHRLQETTAALRPFVADQRRTVDRRIEIAEQHVDQHRIAASRDYAFPLYPEALIRDFFGRQMAAIDPSAI
jgi:hypothetical protein